jgi:hypothetical protein
MPISETNPSTNSEKAHNEIGQMKKQLTEQEMVLLNKNKTEHDTGKAKF